MSGNKAKYLSYQEAWRRIKDAQRHRYYFEAVTLCESIISDRLLSYIHSENPNAKADVRTQFSSLIREWRKAAVTLPEYNGKQDLAVAVDSWRKERNAVIHVLTKSTPGTPTAPIDTFLSRAEAAADEGAKLARAVSNWHRKQQSAKRAKK